MTVLRWFLNNGMVENPDKFQDIFLGTADNNVSIDIGSAKTVGSKQVELLGVTVDHQLPFYPHTTILYAREPAKSLALMRIRNFVTQNQALLVYGLYDVFF